MADLLGNDIGLNYKGLLNLFTTINTGLDATLRVVTDGEGDSSPLYLSTTAIGLGTTSIWDNTNGRLGIGTTSPNNLLGVAGDAQFGSQSTGARTFIYTDPSIFMYDSSNANRVCIDGRASANSYINTGGKFGIGNSSPTGTLDIIAASSTVGLYVKGAASTDIARFYNSAGTAALTVKDDSITSFSKGIEVTPSTNYGLNGGYLTQTANSFLIMREGSSTGYKIAIGTDGTGSTIFYNNQTNSSFVSGEISLTIIGATKNVLIGTTTDIASSLMTLSSTTKGFLPPRMTTTQKNAIASPAAGLMVYDTDLAKLCVYTTAWETITSV